MIEAVGYHKYFSEKYIPNLDGLRAISILLVIIHHIPKFTAHPILERFQQNGRFGVYLFFAISGLLIAQLALQEKKLTGFFNIKNFYIRRTLRLFPLYYVVMAIVCILVFGFRVFPPNETQSFLEKLPSYLFYYSNLGDIGGHFSLLWSLAVEEQFYLIFSLVFFFCSLRLSFGIFLTLLFLHVLSLWEFITVKYLGRVLIQQGTILMGVCFAYLLQKKGFYEVLQRFFGNKIVLWCLALFFIVFLFLYSDNAADPPPLYFEVLIALFVAMAAISPPLPILENPIFAYIGKISYGIYLLHTIILFAVKRFVTDEPLMTFLVGLPLILAVCSLSYEYFEKYFLKLKNRFKSSNGSA